VDLVVLVAECQVEVVPVEAGNLSCYKIFDDKVVAKGCFSGTPPRRMRGWLEFLLTLPRYSSGGPCPFAKMTPFKTSFGFLNINSNLDGLGYDNKKLRGGVR
jgi:hypothetical protein